MATEFVQTSEQGLRQRTVNPDTEVSTGIFPAVSDVAEIAVIIESISAANTSSDVIAIANMSRNLSSETSIQQFMQHFSEICAIGKRPKFDSQNFYYENKGRFKFGSEHPRLT